MLQFGEHDFITRLQQSFAQRIGDKIDAFCGAPHKDNLFGGTGSHLILNFLSRAFVGVRRSCGQSVSRSVDVGIVMRIEVRQCLDHLHRLLSRGRVVEPHEIVIVDLLMEDRKILANLMHIKNDGSRIACVRRFE